MRRERPAAIARNVSLHYGCARLYSLAGKRLRSFWYVTMIYEDVSAGPRLDILFCGGASNDIAN